MKKLNSITKYGVLGTVLLFVFFSINNNLFASGNNCEITKVNGGGFSTTISSVIQVGGQYVITLSIEHDGCGGPSCKELSHYSIEADDNTYSNVSWTQVWGDETMTGNIEMSLGNNDPFDGFKLDNTSNIGGGDAGEFTITYTLTYLQDQQTLAKAGNNYTQIAAFTTADFQQVLNCSSGNNPPLAVNDTYSTNVNTAVSGNVTDNDSDPDGDNITVTTTPVVNPQHGSLTLNSNGTFTYTPNNGFAGTDSFKYKICDDGSPSLCDEAWVTITINTVVGPTANDDSETTPFNTPVDIDALNNDVAGDAALNPTNVTFVAGTEPDAGTEGVFTVNATTGLVTFTPANGFTGTTTIDYTVCDYNSLCATATITVIVSNSVVGPTANDDSETTPFNTPVDIDALNNDVAGDAALNPTTVTFVAGTEPDAGTEGVFTVNATTGLVTFTPANGFTGTTTIDYTVCDLNSLCATATITVIVSNSVVGPTANDDLKTTPFNTPVDIDALDNDVEGDAALNPTTVTFVAGTEPDAGTEGVFTVNATTGLVTFTPANGFTGTTTIDYTVCDLNSLCATATITVVISNANDTDGDGIPDVDDDYPNDPDRAFNNFYPASGSGTLAFEDLWPSKGDYDFNDLIILYRFKTVTNASNHVVETFADFTVKAFGAGYQNGFGFQWPNAAIDQSKITVTGSNIGESYVSLGSNGLENGQSKPTFILYDNTYNIMQHPGMGTGVNTEPWATYVSPVDLSLYIDYVDNTFTLNDLDIPNFNPFIMVNLNRNVEVHLPEYPPTDLANQGLFGTWDDDTSFSNGRYYKTENNLPWAINIPVEFEYPIERQDIIWVYLKFADWAESDGQLYPDWYLDIQGYRNNSLIYDNQP